MLIGLRVLLGLVVLFGLTARACRLHGTESGICVNPDDRKFGPFSDVMKFCGAPDVDGKPPPVSYRACIPLASKLSLNHTVSQKDEWVKEFYDRITAERIAHEENSTLEDAEVRAQCARVRLLVALPLAALNTAAAVRYPILRTLTYLPTPSCCAAAWLPLADGRSRFR